jgi:hypothetical protein
MPRFIAPYLSVIFYIHKFIKVCAEACDIAMKNEKNHKTADKFATRR